MTRLEVIRSEVLACTRCSLATQYNGPVPARWRPELGDPKVMIIGEAPGEQEDKAKQPFIGKSGVSLARWLTLVGIKSAYVTNVVKCRPPDNKDPDAPWIAACATHLASELDAVAPDLILCVGRFAGNAVLGRSSTMGMLCALNDRATKTLANGKVSTVVSIYHPAFYMYGGGKGKGYSEEQNIDAIKAGLKRAGLT